MGAKEGLAFVEDVRALVSPSIRCAAFVYFGFIDALGTKRLAVIKNTDDWIAAICERGFS